MKRWVLCVLGVLMLTAAACGSPPPEAAAPVAAAGPALPGAPIVIGVQSPHNGASAYPQSTFGAEAAAHYINHELGGIDGRPLVLDICEGDGTPETAINCANGFVTSNSPVVFDAYDGSSIGPMVPVLRAAGIPIVGTLGGQGVAEKQPRPAAFYFSGPLETSALGMVTILDRLDLRSASLALDDKPSSHDYVEQLVAPMAQKLGVDVRAVHINESNLNISLLAALELAAEPTVAGVISLPEDTCTDLVEALRRQGFDGTLFAGSCSQFVDELDPADSAGTIIQPRLWLPGSEPYAPLRVRTELQAFEDSMAQVGYADETSARSLYSFAGLVNLARVLATVDGEITNRSVSAAMSGVRDLETFAGPTVTCDGEQWPGKPAACSREAIFFEVQRDGSLRPTGGTGFTELDPSVAASS